MEILVGIIYVHMHCMGQSLRQLLLFIVSYCLFDTEPLFSPLATAVQRKDFTAGEGASLATKHKTMQLPAKESTAERTLSMCNVKWERAQYSNNYTCTLTMFHA